VPTFFTFKRPKILLKARRAVKDIAPVNSSSYIRPSPENAAPQRGKKEK
jgi:hypothetical protein